MPAGQCASMSWMHGAGGLADTWRLWVRATQALQHVVDDHMRVIEKIGLLASGHLANIDAPRSYREARATTTVGCGILVKAVDRQCWCQHEAIAIHRPLRPLRSSGSTLRKQMSLFWRLQAEVHS